MAADIVLNGDTVLVVGRWLEARTHDVKLDSPARRAAAGSSDDGERRALVHDYHDGLTLNWSGDYPGGVTIEGRVFLSTVRIADALIINPTKGRLNEPHLTVMGQLHMVLGADAFEGLAHRVRAVANELWPAIAIGHQPMDRTIPLEGVAVHIAGLTARVRELEDRLAALEP